MSGKQKLSADGDFWSLADYISIRPPHEKATA